MECWPLFMVLEPVTGRFEDLCFVARRVIFGPNRVRRTRLYCVGGGKSGTHSVAEMFSRNVRARHEPEALETRYSISLPSAPSANGDLNLGLFQRLGLPLNLAARYLRLDTRLQDSTAQR